MDKVKEYDTSFELLVLDHDGYEYGYSGKEKEFVYISRNREWNYIEDYDITKTHPFTDEEFTELDYLQAEIELIKAQKEISDANKRFLKRELAEKEEFIGWIREFGLEKADELYEMRHLFKNMFANCCHLTSIPRLDTTDRVSEEIQILREQLTRKHEDKGE